MKCYFALSDDVSNNDSYYSMLLCTLESARKNTSLDLHCLYDFRKAYSEKVEDDRIYSLLQKYNVAVHLISIDFENELFNIYTDDYLTLINVTKSSLYSRFLRFMLGDVEKEDTYVFYADTDIIFLKDFTLESFEKLPETVGVCPEFTNNYSYSYFNAGIMLINLDSYRKAKEQLLCFLKNGVKAPVECCDQGYLNLIYKKDFMRMNNCYNWKPYWGINKDAVILHLHGLKPTITENAAPGYQQYISFLIKQNKQAKDGWKYYFELFSDYASDYVNKSIVLKNIEYTLDSQRPEDFTILKRIIKKIKTIFSRR